MGGTIDRGTLDRLIALGRERGELTAEALQAALPVDTMDVDALDLVMLELEAAGISVEPDVLGPRADRPLPAAPELPPVDGGVSPPIVRAASERGATRMPRRRSQLRHNRFGTIDDPLGVTSLSDHRHLIQVGAVVGGAAGATPAAAEEAAAEAEEAANSTAAVVVEDRAVAEGAARASPSWWQAPQ